MVVWVVAGSYEGSQVVIAEDTLTANAVAGDLDALNALLRRHHDAILRHVAPKIGARHQGVISAEDVLQVTYIEAFLEVTGFESKGPGSFLAWLIRIAEHNLADAMRALDRQKRTPPGKRIEMQVQNDDSGLALIDQLMGSSTTASKVFRQKEANALLEDALTQLPPDYGAVVRQFDLHGSTVAQVSHSMNRTIGAVYMLRARAHDRLGAILRRSQFFTN